MKIVNETYIVKKVGINVQDYLHVKMTIFRFNILWVNYIF